MKMKIKINNKYRKIIIISLILVVFVIIFEGVYGATATTPTLVNKLNSAFKKIQTYLVKLAAPVAGVAIATGVLIRKLSFGDEEKMVKGKKVIINAIVCYGVILSIDLIIKFVESILK